MGKKKPITINETLDRVILDSSERVFYFTKKKLKRRRYIILFVIFLSAVSFTLYSLFVKANILNFYPSSCLGTWDNPQNAQGEPSLGPDAKHEEFNKDNSAFYDGGGAKQIFCGGFKSNSDTAEKIFKKAVLRFSWVIASPTPVPLPILEQSQFENQILDLPASSSLIIIPNQTTPASNSNEANPQSEISHPVSSPLENPAGETPLPNPSSEPVPPAGEPTPVPTPEPTPSPAEEPMPSPVPEPPVSSLGHFTFADIFSDVVSDSILPSASSTPASISRPASFSPLPAPTATPTPSLTSPASLPPSVILSAPNLLASPSLGPASASYSLDDFLEVFYTTDGQNWQSLGRVNKDNFDGLKLEIPINSWGELENLQVSVQGVFTTDTGQKVFLDGMWVETSYEPTVTPTVSNSLDISSSAELIKNRINNIKPAIANTIVSKYILGEGRTVTILNNEGVNNFAVSGADLSGKQIVTIYSGADGGMIKNYQLEGPYPGLIAAISDVNSDGYSDYAILDPGYSTHDDGAIYNEKGIITAYSGKDGAVLWTYIGEAQYQFQSGNSRIVLGGDYNGDGKNDLLVGAPALGDYGAILVLSSATGKEIKRFAGTQESGVIGSSFDVGSDLDKDGLAEIAVGEKYYEAGSTLNAGRVLMLSGGDFHTIFEIMGSNQDNAFFGVLAGFAGDLSGDGVSDLMIDSHEKSEQGSAGVIYFVSGADGSIIKKISDIQAYQDYQNLFLLNK